MPPGLLERAFCRQRAEPPDPTQPGHFSFIYLRKCFWGKKKHPKPERGRGGRSCYLNLENVGEPVLSKKAPHTLFFPAELLIRIEKQTVLVIFLARTWVVGGGRDRNLTLF